MAVAFWCGPPRLAHRVLGYGDEIPRRADRRSRRRAGPGLQPSRVGARAVGVLNRQGSLRPRLDAHWPRPVRRPEDEQVAREPGARQPGAPARARGRGAALPGLASISTRLELRVVGPREDGPAGRTHPRAFGRGGAGGGRTSTQRGGGRGRPRRSPWGGGVLGP